MEIKLDSLINKNRGEIRINISLKITRGELWRRFAALDMPRLIPHNGRAGHILRRALDAEIRGKRRRGRRSLQWRERHDDCWAERGGCNEQGRMGGKWSATPATSDDGTSQGWRRRRHDSRKVKLGDNLGALERKKFQKSEITIEVGGWAEVSLGIFLWEILPK